MNVDAAAPSDSAGADPADRTTILHGDGPNALARAIGLLGDEWTLLLVRAALDGATRYSQFQAVLPISHAVLSQRLETLVSEGLMDRRQYQEHPPRSEYRLNPRGWSLWPVLIAIWSWERRMASTDPIRTPPMRHRVCGQEMTPSYRCRHCGQPVDVRQLHVEWGPSGGWARTVPEATTRRRSSTNGAKAFYPSTMSVLGNRWSAAIVGAAFRGIRRFGDFQDALGCPPSVLAERLNSLCEHGVLESVASSDRADWSEYRLTRKGHALFPVIDMVVDWAQRWYLSDEGPVLERTHLVCGAPLRGELVCDQCGVGLHGPDIEVGAPD